MSDTTQLAVTEQPQQGALTALDRAVIALGGTEREDALKALAKKYADITEVKNKAGRQQVHAAAMELANERIATKKTGETAREDANALQKAVIDRQKVLIGIVEPEERRLLALRDKFDEAEEAEKQAKAAAEKFRVDAIRKRITEMQSIPAMLVGKQSNTIAAAIDSLESVEIALDSFAEFAVEGEVAKLAAVHKLWEMFVAQKAHEAEQARIAAEREAIEKQRAELAEQEARDRAERERIAAEQRAEQEKAAAELRAQQEEHEARMRAQQAEIDRQQAEIAAERQRQADEAARVEREKQTAIAAEAARVAAEEQRKREEAEAAARVEAERLERERQAEAERAALAAEVSRLQALHFADDGLGMLEDVLQEIAQPIGQDCCGHPEFDMGYVCCGNAEPAYHTIDSLSVELNKWRDEIIERRQHKEAA